MSVLGEARGELAAPWLAEVWVESAEATAEWMANNPGPSGIPSDPPTNPYEQAPA